MKTIPLLFLIPFAMLSSVHAQEICTNPDQVCDQTQEHYTRTDQGSLSQQDLLWMNKTTENSLFEIALANVAVTRAKTNAVKAYANAIILKETLHLAELQSGVESLGICLPNRPSKDQLIDIEFFRGYSSCDWDRDYLNYGVFTHLAGIQSAEEELSTGQDALVLEFALRNKTLMYSYLQLAGTANSSIGTLCSAVPNSP